MNAKSGFATTRATVTGIANCHCINYSAFCPAQTSQLCFQANLSFIQQPMSDQGTTKKRPLEEEAQDIATSSSNGAGAASAGGQEGRDGPSSKRPRPEESSSSSSLPAGSAPSAAPPHPEQQQRPRSSRPALFFGSNIPDDVVQAVADFLFDRCHGENIEVKNSTRHMAKASRTNMQ